eukprot:4223444-Pyramimonas_sp.AAC.1
MDKDRRGAVSQPLSGLGPEPRPSSSTCKTWSPSDPLGSPQVDCSNPAVIAGAVGPATNAPGESGFPPAHTGDPPVATMAS